MHKVLANAICALVPGKERRHYLRTRLMFNVKKYIEFARNDANMPNAGATIHLGYSSTRRIIIVLDNKIAYKIPLRESLANIPEKEKAFADAFRKISPIRIPESKVISATIDGKKRKVLKYEYINGTPVGKLSRETIKKHGAKIAKQLAAFLYTIGGYTKTPKSIAGFKPKNAPTPGFMYGWSHNDIGGNFLVDENTGDITGVIDWENATYGDWSGDMIAAHKYLAEINAGDIIVQTIIEYGKLYYSKK